MEPGQQGHVLSTGPPSVPGAGTSLPGDRFFSGSFCVTGTAYFEADQAGASRFANRLTATARQFQVTHTPLHRRIDLVVRLVMLVVVVMSIIILVTALLEGLPTVDLEP
jgi:cation-transporting ATPase E